MSDMPGLSGKGQSETAAATAYASLAANERRRPLQDRARVSDNETGTRALSPETIKYFDTLLAIYTDNIRISDVKSNIILFFLAISIPTIVAFRAQLPLYVPLFLLLLLPLFSIILLILAIYPRFVATPGFPFFIRREVRAGDFVTPPEDADELLDLFRNRCAALAKILYWKVFLFRIAIGVSLFYLAILFFLAIGGALSGTPAEAHLA
jgi:hypothetical protein